MTELLKALSQAEAFVSNAEKRVTNLFDQARSKKQRSALAAAAEAISDAGIQVTRATAAAKNAEADMAHAITVGGQTISRIELICYMQMMEQQKERVDALLLAIKNELDPGTFGFILADLAKSLQADHAHWYRLQDMLGIRDDLLEEANHG